MVNIPTTVKNKALVEKRRQQIILAAIKLFSRKGFHKTNLKELASEAGLSYGNIYDYVGSKEDIFFLIHDFLANSVMEILSRSIEDVNDPIEKLRRIVKGEFNLMDQWADAVMLLYQEIHILEGEFLRKLLQKEREHLEKFEVILCECIANGQLKPCNVRLVANLIKSMIDTWTIKRWDLRGHSNRIEAEKTIMSIVIEGLAENKSPEFGLTTEVNSFYGKKALLVNGGTFIGQAVCNALLKKGAEVIVHIDTRVEAWKSSQKNRSDNFCEPSCLLKQDKSLTASQIDDIEKQYGPIDFYLHDLGIGNTDVQEYTKTSVKSAGRLEENLNLAHELAYYFQKKMGSRFMGRIVYLAPWAWDAHFDPIGFDMVKAGIAALTNTMAKKLAYANVNVNCIVPGYIRGVRPFKIEKALGRDLLRDIPSGCLGEAFDITKTVFFLLEDDTKYLTGQVLNVTGGK